MAPARAAASMPIALPGHLLVNAAVITVGFVHREANSRLFTAKGAADQTVAGGDAPQPVAVLCDIEMVRAVVLRRRHGPMHLAYPSIEKSEAGAQKQSGAGQCKKPNPHEEGFDGGPNAPRHVRGFGMSKRVAA